MQNNIRRGARPSAGAAALVAACFLLTACSVGAGGGDSAPAAKAERGNGQRSGASDEGAGGTTGDRATSGTSQTSARVLPAPRDIIYRGNITVRVKDVPAAAEQVERIARAANGEVSAEETSTEGPASEAHARLTLRVPPGAEFRRVLREVAGVGKRLHQSQTAEDVTTQVVDTESRIESQRRSVIRVRALLEKATTIGEVVQVEAELARREADLESFEAQLERLKSVTSMATIEVDLVGTSAPEPKKDDELGFGEGFRGGWDAFVQMVLVVLTVLGALLPFAVTLGLVGVPAWLLLRTRLRLRQAAATEPPPA